MNASVVVASCITLKPLFARLFPLSFLTSRSRKSQQPSWGSGGVGTHKTFVTIGSADNKKKNSIQEHTIRVESRFSAEVGSEEDDVELGNLRRQYRAPFAVPSTQ